MSERQNVPSSVVTVGAVARTVVAALAPEELPDFEVYLTAYEESPSALKKATRRSDDPGAFGTGAAQPLTTGVITAVDAALTELAQDTTGGAAKGLGR
jgi:hypothetical protein